MIAAARRRIGPAFARVSKRPARWSRSLDRVANRGLERAYPVLLRARRWARTWWRRFAGWAGPRVRPWAARLFRALAVGERWVRRAGTVVARGARRARAEVTAQRALGLAVIVAGACLVVSQFIDYRAVEIGQPGYAGLPDVARPPTVAVRTAGEAHSYLLLPLGLLAVGLGALIAVRRRRRLGLAVAGLGLLAVAVILLVDLPRGLDAGAQTSRFAGARAVLESGFYVELAAAAGLVFAGLLYYARPCRIRTNSSGRAASARRRRPRRPGSSRGRVARSA